MPGWSCWATPGLVNLGLTALGILKKPVRFLYNWKGVIICLVYFVIPYAAFSLIGPIRNVPRTLEEAAVNMGASRLTVFLRVVLPLTLPGIVEAASLTYSLALSAFLFPMMLGGGKVKMMSNVIYETIYVTFDFPFAGTHGHDPAGRLHRGGGGDDPAAAHGAEGLQ